MRLGQRSEVGAVRARNEDTALTVVGPDGCLVGVFDGMGGHPAGDVASATARATVEALLGPTIAGNGRADTVPADDAAADADTEAATELADALVRADASVRAAATGERAGMGTTAVLAYVTRDRVRLAHVGDSRAYLLRGGVALPLTSDHGRGGYLTQAIGLGVRPEVATVALHDGDRVMLCTDGLSGLVDDDRIGELGSHADPQLIAGLLVDAALMAGGYDNVTVVVVDPAD